MANRFFDSNYYKSPFVRGLKGPLKSLYSFIICDCTPSGVWPLDVEAASLYIGFQITAEEFDENFVKKGKAVNIGSGKYFFPDFIEHQYPSGLQSWNKSHNKIIIELNNLGFLDEKKDPKLIPEKYRSTGILYFTHKGASKGLQSPQGNGNGNGNGNKRGSGGKFSDFELKFSDALKQSCLEILSTAQFGTDKKITKDHVENLFTQFCEIQKSSTEYYKDEDAVWVHFKRWLPKQKINGTHQSGIKSTRHNKGAHDLLDQIKSEANSGRK